MTRTEPSASRPRLLPWFGCALLAWIAWRILALGLADHLSNTDPAEALYWRSDHAPALLGASLASRDPASAQELARRALHANPLQGVAYRALAASIADPTTQRALHEVAARRAPRDVPALAWMADHALARGEPAEALASIDQMLRVEPRSLDTLRPALEFLASQPDARGALVAALRDDPPWRTAALVTLARDAVDSTAVTAVFSRLQQEHALAMRELDAWVGRLIREREWIPAYHAWIGSFAHDRRVVIGNVYNGDFESAPTGSGFDWRLTEVDGARVRRAAIEGAGGTAALRVDFDHRRVPFAHVEQLLVLPPGRYRLSGRARLDHLRTSQGMAWTLACAEGGGDFARTPAFAGHRDWASFRTEFEVPAHDCGAQWLRLRHLAGTLAEQHIGGSIWFDDLAIRLQAESVPERVESSVRSGVR